MGSFIKKRISIVLVLLLTLNNMPFIVSAEEADKSTGKESLETVETIPIQETFNEINVTDFVEISASDFPESPHPYENNMDTVFSYTYPGAVEMEIVFSQETYLEENWDEIKLYDKNDKILGRYTGDGLSGERIFVSGDTLKIHLKTNDTNTEYGFTVDNIIIRSETGVGIGKGKCGENLSWELSPEGILTISGSGAMYDFDCNENKPYWYNIKESIQKIVIEDGVTAVDDYAFFGCIQLESFQVDGDNSAYCSEDGVLYTKDQSVLVAYPNKKGSSFSVPDSVIEIADDAFGGCDNLETVDLPQQLLTIGKEAFHECIILNRINIPETVTNIEDYAFWACYDLSKITFAGNAPVLGEGCFQGVTADVYYPAGDETWVNSKFEDYMGKLTWIPDSTVSSIFVDTLPDCVEYNVGDDLDLTGIIVKAVFENGKTGLVPSRSITADEYDFSSPGEKKVTIRYGGCTDEFQVNVTVTFDEIVEVPVSEFPESSHPYANNSNIVYLYSYSGASEMEVSFSKKTCLSENDRIMLYDGNDKLLGNYTGTELSGEKVQISGDTIKIQLIADDSSTEYGFSIDSIIIYSESDIVLASGICGDNLLWELSQDGTLTITGEGAMYNYERWDGWKTCWYNITDRIQKIVIGNGVTTIGDYAFKNCWNVKSVSLPSGVVSIGNHAFDCCSITNIELPSEISIIGNHAFEGCNSLMSIELPEGITEIGASAFDGCTALTSIRIPASVDKLGQAVFSGCSELSWFEVDAANSAYCSLDGVLYTKDQKELISFPNEKSNSFTIPDSVTLISYKAFYGCSNLIQVEMPDTVISLGANAFSNCNNLKDIKLSSGIEKLQSAVFRSCSSLSDIVIPENVSEIDEYVFEQCTGLRSVRFTGNAPEICKYENTFIDIETDVYYPAGNETWTNNMFQNYGGKLTWMPDSPVISITVAVMPKYVTYCLGEELDITGIIVEAEFENGKKGVVPTKGVSVDTYDFSTPGEKTITVYYGESQTEYTVTVLNTEAIEIPASEYPESSHPYDCNMDQMYMYSYPGAVELAVTFSQDTLTDIPNDYIYLYDSNDNELGVYCGGELSGARVRVPGDTLKIRLVTNGSISEYGFSIESIIAYVELSSASELKITSHPVDYSGKVGDNAVFQIIAEGEGLIYQWEYQNAESSTWKKSGQNGNKTNTLSVPITEARNGQKYRCAITDSSGNQMISESATLYVEEIPDPLIIIGQPENYTGVVGETAVFTVVANGMDLSYQWQYQNVESSTWKSSGQSGNKTNTLNVPITEARNGQKYRCIVTDGNANQVISDEAVIYVEEVSDPLIIIGQPENYTGAVGETAVFTIEAIGTDLSYQWQYQNAGTSTWKSSGQMGNKTNTLNVPITAARDGQKYCCVISDSAGNQITSETATLIVKNAEELVTIIGQPEDYTGAVGETAVFTVTASGEDLTYQWQYQNVGTTVWKASGQTGNKTNTLKVPITAARNGQKYRCVVTDSSGNTITSDAAVLYVAE